jgi:cation transport regulator ChaC
MFHFAYGSNMSRALMAARCPGARALGIATLAGWRFVINPDGVGSIAPEPGALLRGVVWRLGLRDLVALNAYESVDTSLYLRRMLPVVREGRRLPALAYIARRHGQGRARPGYITVVVAAAREWNLPEGYISSLQRWSPSGWRGTRAKDTGELG